MSTDYHSVKTTPMIEYDPAIDISVHQGDMIVSKAKAKGIGMFYARGLFGTKEDLKFKENVRRFKINGVQFGVYIWFRPIRSAKSQAAALIKLHKESGATLVPMIDVEDSSGLPPLIVRIRLAKMVELVTAGIGKPPAIYTGYPFWIKHVKSTDPKFARCPLWLARYPVYSHEKYKLFPVPVDPKKWAEWAFQFNRDPIIPAPWKIWAAWQFSAGFNGCGPRYGAASNDLDLNLIRKAQSDRFRLP